jgi:hypothetical protein
LFVVEEELLAGRENELGAAVDALQDSVRKFHGRLPKTGSAPKSAMKREELAVPVSQSSCESTTRARAATGQAAKTAGFRKTGRPNSPASQES